MFGREKILGPREFFVCFHFPLFREIYHPTTTHMPGKKILPGKFTSPWVFLKISKSAAGSSLVRYWILVKNRVERYPTCRGFLFQKKRGQGGPPVKVKVIRFVRKLNMGDTSNFFSAFPLASLLGIKPKAKCRLACSYRENRFST